ncbi:MAG TPA: hypothetical protein DEV93_02455 [Chloroflexi bacterium]|nr:hypothetical protein [Chloroflexota bacterium]
MWVVLLTGCSLGGTAAVTPRATLSPAASPTPDVGAEYSDAVNAAFDSLGKDRAAIVKAKPRSAAEKTAAGHMSGDYQAFLDTLDLIPFPLSAKDDLAALKKSLVALQVFWSNVSIDTATYSALVDKNLNDVNNAAELLLGHDVGVSLVISPYPSPTPSK